MHILQILTKNEIHHLREDSEWIKLDALIIHYLVIMTCRDIDSVVIA